MRRTDRGYIGAEAPLKVIAGALEQLCDHFAQQIPSIETFSADIYALRAMTLDGAERQA